MTSRTDDVVEILLVEDNPGDVRLTQEALTQLSIETTTHVAIDGDEALQFLSKRNRSETESLPDLVLLDLNLPRMGGLEVLEALADEPLLARIPVLVLTSSDTTEDIGESYDLAANAYLTKPTDPTEYTEMVEALAHFWFEQAALPPMSH